MKCFLLILLLCTPIDVHAGIGDEETTNDKPLEPGVRTPSTTPESNPSAKNNGSGKSQQPGQPPAPAKPQLIKQDAMNNFVNSVQAQNGAKSGVESGVSRSTQNTAAYQAATAQAQMHKAILDDMAASGKYDLTGYHEAMTALSIPTQAFNYKPGEGSAEAENTPTAPSMPTEIETTKTPGFSTELAPTTPVVTTTPSAEIADPNIPVDESAARSIASGPVETTPTVPASTANSPPLSPIITPVPSATETGAKGNTLQFDTSVASAAPGSKNDKNGSLTKEAPARGLASSGEPTEEQIAAAVSKKILEDHKKKLAGKDDKNAKPSLADRLKSSPALPASTTSADVHAPPTAPAASVPPTNIKDEVFWFGPQKFGRFLLEAAGLEKQLGLDKPRREPTGVAAPTATDWLQVLMGWTAGLGLLFVSAMTIVRKRIRALFTAITTAPVDDTFDSSQIEPSSETEFREISSHVDTAVLEIDTDSQEGGTGVYVVEKSKTGKVMSRAKLAANSVVSAKMLRPKDQKALPIKDPADRIKYAGNGVFEKTSEPVCIIVHGNAKPKK